MRKPKIIISKCLNSYKCRYDGQGYNDKVIQSLINHVDIKMVCPEVEIGLETPRNPIKIEKHDEEYKLVQNKSGNDFTNTMTEFAEEFIKNIDDVDGFILKSKSPSCGINDVKVYTKDSKCSLHNEGVGFFTKKVLDSYSNIPIESDGRLRNYSIRDDFFTKLFMINNLKDSSDIERFHKENRLLLKSYDKNLTKELDNIMQFSKLEDYNYKEYENIFYTIIKKKRNKEDKIMILEDAFNKYKDKLNTDEINMFRNIVKSYENNKLPFSSLVIPIKFFAIRFNDNEVLNQVFFNPYPEELIDINDSGKGRNL